MGYRFSAAVFVLCLAACGASGPSAGDAGSDGGEVCGEALTGAYPDTGFATTAAAEASLLAKLNALNAAMRPAELDAGVVVPRSVIDELFDAGTPSLRSLTSAAYVPVVDEALTAFVAAQGQAWTPTTSPTGAGGLYGSGTSSWIFSARGLDLRQIVDKGLYVALFYAEAAKRIPLVASGDDVDRLVALFGATPSFPQNDTTAPGRDELAAKYTKRRNAPDMPGLYTRIRDAFVEARLASALARCDATRDAALSRLKLDWEKALMATVVFYAASAATKLQDANATATSKASALHDLGEGIGFIYGFKAVPATQRRITDAQLDGLLTALGAPTLSTATVHRLVADVPPDLDGLVAVGPQLQGIYGFTTDEMTLFKTSY